MTHFDLDEVTELAYRMRMVMRLYLHSHPAATSQELERVAVSIAGNDHDEETVLAANICALVHIHLEDLRLAVPVRDPALTEAILDCAFIDLDNRDADIRTLARKSWCLWMEYSKRKPVNLRPAHVDEED